METQKKQTKIALIWNGEMFHISFNPHKENRDVLRNEDEKCNPYELFVNNRSPADMMNAIDRLEANAFDMMRINEAFAFEPSAAKDLARLYSEKPTRTDVINAQDLIDKWGKDSGVKVDLAVDFPNLIKASRDLNIACKLLLYLIDECPERFVREFLLDFPQLKREGVDDLVGAYYERLQSAQEEKSILNMNPEHLKGEKFAGHRAKGMFNLLLSGASPKIVIGDLGEVILLNAFNDSLVGIWIYFARMMQKNKVAVCDWCGDIFIRERKTGKYCSRSCSVTASKNR